MKIFISHSSYDKEIADSLITFLVRGVGVAEEAIFCSSSPGNDIPLGVNFNDYILEQIKGDGTHQVLAIISNNYYNSKYCLYELGAAWGVSQKPIIPILVHNMKYAQLQDFIRFNEAVIANERKGLNKLIDHFSKEVDLKLSKVAQDKLEIEREKFIQELRKHKPAVPPKREFSTKRPNYKFKAVAFDFDGTILQGSGFKYSWKEIWKILNLPEEKRKQLWSKHMQNHKEYDYQTWCDECADNFRNRNFNKAQIAEIFKKQGLKLAKGFEETIKILKQLDFKLCIISGGINTFIEDAIPDDVYDMFDRIVVNEFHYSADGSLLKIKAYQNSESDTTGKVRALEEFCDEFGMSPSEVVFVGEGTNDIDVATTVGMAISYPAGKAAVDFNNLPEVMQINEESIVSIISKILVLPD